MTERNKDVLAWVILMTLTVIMACMALMALSGCALLDEYKDDAPDLITDIAQPDEKDEPDEPEQPDEPQPRQPVDPATVPISGEFVPDPVLVKYVFEFADGTTLTFKENHSDDFWGDYPKAGWGQIGRPDGTVEGIDANTRIRHAGLRIAKTPVTTLDHGARMFWMADSEGNANVKRVTIFADGWNPLVEGAVLAVQGYLGIESHLVRCAVTVEATK